MPSLGADMDVGTVTEWLVAPGDEVRRGDIVAVVDTAKSEVEVETFDDGVVREILVPPGEQVPVGTVLATIDDGSRSAPRRRASPVARHRAAELGIDLASLSGSGRNGTITRADVERAAEDARHAPAPGGPPASTQAPEPTPEAVPTTAPEPIPAPAPEPLPETRPEPVPEPPPAPGPASAAAPTSARRRVSPYARRLAASAGVDLDSLDATGPGGVVRAADVRSATAPARVGEHEPVRAVASAPAPIPPIPAEPPAPAGTARAPAGRDQREMRAAIARLMTTAKREIPHYYLQTRVDLHRGLSWMHEHNRAVPVTQRLVPSALVLAATARAVAAHPEVNGHWVDDAFRPADRVRLGVAVSLRGGGLVAPAIEDADGLPVAELMTRLRDLVTRARAGRLRRTELLDPSITVTNLGDQGVETVFGVIYPPQVALVGVGRVVDAPVAVDGLVGVHSSVTLTLSADHRATDGFTGARFLNAIDDLLQRPEEWTHEDR